MLSRSALTRGVFAVLTASVILVITSCGGTDDGLGRRFPVSGKVTYNGKPLAKGSISFVPDDPKGVGASGAIENGSYAMSTGGNSDGARSGKYKVTITAKEDSSAKAKADFEKARAALPKGSGTENLGFVPRQFVIKAEAEAKSLIPAGYGDVRTTTLTAEVKEQSNNPTIQHDRLQALRRRRAPRAKGAGERPRPQRTVVFAGFGIQGQNLAGFGVRVRSDVVICWLQPDLM